jgi:hypothetical protein
VKKCNQLVINPNKFNQKVAYFSLCRILKYLGISPAAKNVWSYTSTSLYSFALKSDVSSNGKYGRCKLYEPRLVYTQFVFSAFCVDTFNMADVNYMNLAMFIPSLFSVPFALTHLTWLLYSESWHYTDVSG